MCCSPSNFQLNPLILVPWIIYIAFHWRACAPILSSFSIMKSSFLSRFRAVSLIFPTPYFYLVKAKTYRWISGMVFLVGIWFWIPVLVILIPSFILHITLIMVIRERQKDGHYRSLFYRLFIVQVIMFCPKRSRVVDFLTFASTHSEPQFGNLTCHISTANCKAWFKCKMMTSRCKSSSNIQSPRINL